MICVTGAGPLGCLVGVCLACVGVDVTVVLLKQKNAPHPTNKGSTKNKAGPGRFWVDSLQWMLGCHCVT